MNKEKLESILVEYGVSFTDALADRLLKEFFQEEKGEWITDNIDDGYVECPFCHSLTNCEWGKYDDLHFCFNCGADMRAEPYKAESEE